MANEAGGSSGPQGPNAGKELPQHPLVESLKPDPAQPARKSVVLTGLPGRSDRPGYQRLYLTTKLDYYAEFPTQDILSAQVIPADRSPFTSQEATQVAIARESTIFYILARSAQPVDEFDLDIRLGAPGAMAAAVIQTPNTCDLDGKCGTGDTCPRTACDTCPHTHCNTGCNQATCGAQNTCVNTQCQQNTCVNTQCQQNTCVNTQCQQATCPGYHTCAGVTCVYTNCHQHTCANTCFTCPHPICRPQ
jgi:hypothetical protein